MLGRKRRDGIMFLIRTIGIGGSNYIECRSEIELKQKLQEIRTIRSSNILHRYIQAAKKIE